MFCDYLRLLVQEVIEVAILIVALLVVMAMEWCVFFSVCVCVYVGDGTGNSDLDDGVKIVPLIVFIGLN